MPWGNPYFYWKIRNLLPKIKRKLQFPSSLAPEFEVDLKIDLFLVKNQVGDYS